MRASLERYRHRGEVRIEVKELSSLMTPTMERSMYLHPNPLAREIFWQRLDEVYRLVRGLPAECTRHCLDLGGGTGVLARTIAGCFDHYTIVDLEPEDARRVIDHFGNPNVEILSENIFDHRPRDLYTTIIAADVLEHFEELDLICQKVDALLAPGGRLVVSLPTENALYRVGRIVLRKSKPADHYHDSREVIEALQRRGLRLLEKSWIPSFGIPLPLFDIAILGKSGGKSGE